MKGDFLSDLVISQSSYSSWGLWRLDEPLIYRSGTTQHVVPKGFMTDGASIPRLLWGVLPPFGRYAKAAVLHDYLLKTFPRAYCDAVFRDALRVCDVNDVRADFMYAAVRVFSLWRRWFPKQATT